MINLENFKNIPEEKIRHIGIKTDMIETSTIGVEHYADKKIKIGFNDNIFVGYDFSDGKDETVLVVGRRENKELNIINIFRDEEAEKIYNILLGEVKI